MSLTHIGLAPFFVRHWQTIQTQIRRRRMWRLIRVSTVCLQNVSLMYENKNKPTQQPLKRKWTDPIDKVNNRFGLYGLMLPNFIINLKISFFFIIVSCLSCLFSYRDNLLQIRVYYETLMTKQEDQILEFTSEDLMGRC